MNLYGIDRLKFIGIDRLKEKGNDRNIVAFFLSGFPDSGWGVLGGYAVHIPLTVGQVYLPDNLARCCSGVMAFYDRR